MTMDAGDDTNTPGQPDWDRIRREFPTTSRWVYMDIARKAMFSFASNDRRQPTLELAHDAHRFEYGNPNFLGCWVQKRSARFIVHIGLDNIEARVRALTTRLIEEAGRRQLRIRTPIRWEERAGIVSIDLGRHAGETVAKLKDQRVVVSEKDGHLRTSVHIYNNEEDIERLLCSLQRC